MPSAATAIRTFPISVAPRQDSCSEPLRRGAYTRAKDTDGGRPSRRRMQYECHRGPRVRRRQTSRAVTATLTLPASGGRVTGDRGARDAYRGHEVARREAQGNVHGASCVAVTVGRFCGRRRAWRPLSATSIQARSVAGRSGVFVLRLGVPHAGTVRIQGEDGQTQRQAEETRSSWDDTSRTETV